MQLLNIKHGGTVKASNKREYGPAALLPETCAGLYRDMSPSSQVWMSHSDTVDHLAEGCRVIARNAEGVPVSLQWGETTFGIQFHPEVTHSHEGRTILRNFLSCAANLKKFNIGDFKRELIREIRERVGNRQVVCGVSGGVDSTVLAVLLHEAGVNMRAIFVDNGLLRKNEAEEVRANFARMNVEIETVDASERFLAALDGESDPEKKRRIIGGLFIDVFWDAVGDAEMLAQGTLYPDVIESASNAKSKASVIKTHHNRVERVLELQAQGKVLEPLAELFKDEVRQLGIELGLPEQLVWVVLAVLVTALGASLYQTADLGIAPYDYLSLGLRDYTHFQYFGCRVFTDAFCALLCWLLGGLVGLGTLICAFCLGPFIQFFNGLVSERVLQYKPEKA